MKLVVYSVRIKEFNGDSLEGLKIDLDNAIQEYLNNSGLNEEIYDSSLRYVEE